MPNMTSHDILEFPNYENKLKSARLRPEKKEAVVCGTAKVMGEDCAVFCMVRIYDGQHGHGCRREDHAFV